MSSNRKRSSFITAVPIEKLGDPSVGMRLRYFRKKLGYTQNDVAEKAGISQSVVSRIEKHPMDGSIGQLRSICAVLKITLLNLVEDIPVLISPSEQTFVKTRLREASKFASTFASIAESKVEG